MGWANCGNDKNGRPIGYAHEAVCDHPGCNEKIDRGLSYACGGMHGEDEYGCDKYFCSAHLSNWVETDSGEIVRVCDECKKVLIESGQWTDDENEGCLVRRKDI